MNEVDWKNLLKTQQEAAEALDTMLSSTKKMAADIIPAFRLFQESPGFTSDSKFLMENCIQSSYSMVAILSKFNAEFLKYMASINQLIALAESNKFMKEDW